jgi:DNA-binding protein H-NS
MKLDKMTVVELKKLQGDVETAIRTRQKKDLADAKAAAEKAASEFGFSLAELVGGAKPGTKAKAAPKYRNPENVEQTWTGRGRKPQWIVDALNAGTDITALEI